MEYTELLEKQIIGRLQRIVFSDDTAGSAEPCAVRKIPAGNGLYKGVRKKKAVHFFYLTSLTLFSFGSGGPFGNLIIV